jgi:hypothetical protein
VRHANSGDGNVLVNTRNTREMLFDYLALPLKLGQCGGVLKVASATLARTRVRARRYDALGVGFYNRNCVGSSEAAGHLGDQYFNGLVRKCVANENHLTSIAARHRSPRRGALSTHNFMRSNDEWCIHPRSLPVPRSTGLAA